VKVLYECFSFWEKLSTSRYKFILEPSAIDVVRIADAVCGLVGTVVVKHREKNEEGGL
jgi:hypothetical protein